MNQNDFQVDSQLLSAVVAGAVALVVSLVTWAIARRKDHSDRMRQERELQRKLTEKLYDLRARHYPRAFSITQGLLGNVLLASQVSSDEVDQVRMDLANWVASEASFILSKRSLDAYYAIREALAVEPLDDGTFSRSQRESMWRAKNQFRRCLRDDVHLLFTEDRPLERGKPRAPAA